jgi:hypothetical protein
MLAVFLWQRFVMQLSDEIVRLCAVFLLMATVGATTAIWRITLFSKYTGRSSIALSQINKSFLFDIFMHFTVDSPPDDGNKNLVRYFSRV